MSADKHAQVAMDLQQAFKKALPPGYWVCAMIIDTNTPDGPPFEMFVVRNVPADVGKEIAGAFADGKPSLTVRVTEVRNGGP